MVASPSGRFRRTTRERSNIRLDPNFCAIFIQVSQTVSRILLMSEEMLPFLREYMKLYLAIELLFSLKEWILY